MKDDREKDVIEIEFTDMVTENIYVNIEEVNRNIKNWGYRCLDKVYINAKTKLNLIDNEGYKYYATYDSLKGTGGKTNFVSNKNIYAIENIKLWLLKKGLPYTLLSENFKGNKNKIKLHCDIHNIDFEIEWSNLSSGQHCYMCGEEIRLSKMEKYKTGEKKKKSTPRKNSKYKYSIGDVVNNKIIIEQIRMPNGNNKKCKGYLVKCVEDNYEWEITEYNLVKRGCPVCSNKVCMRGVNDIATTNPEMIKYFKNKEDAYTHTSSCLDEVEVVCPKCGNIKVRKIDGIKRDGIGCLECSNTISTPERVMRSLLSYLDIDYINEKRFDWAGLKRYDFYLPDYNMIIETHGGQHYYKSNRGNRTLEEEQENDRLKKELALSNGVEHYIVIDCRRSEYEFIKKNIKNSEILNIINKTRVNWDIVFDNASKPILDIICDLWNKGYQTVLEISKIVNLSDTTVREYLKQGVIIGKCDYNPNKAKIHNVKKVYCFEEDIILESPLEMSNYLNNKYNTNIKDYTIRNICCGRQLQTKGFTFEYR